MMDTKRGKVQKRTDMPMVGVGVFVKKDGKYILSKRKGSHGAGKYSLPGGHIEYFETMEKAAKNEVREETGMEITNVRILTATDSLFPEEKLHYVTVFLIADWLSGEPINMEEEYHEDWKWYSIEEFPEPYFEGLDKALEIIKNDYNSQIEWLASTLAYQNNNIICEYGDAGKKEFWLKRAKVETL